MSCIWKLQITKLSLVTVICTQIIPRSTNNVLLKILVILNVFGNHTQKVALIQKLIVCHNLCLIKGSSFSTFHSDVKNEPKFVPVIMKF